MMDPQKIFRDLISSKLLDCEVSEILAICDSLEKRTRNSLEKDALYYELSSLFCRSGMLFEEFKQNLQNREFLPELYYDYCLKKKLSKENKFNHYYWNIIYVLKSLYADKEGGKEFRGLIVDEDYDLFYAIANAIVDLLVEISEQAEDINYYDEWYSIIELSKQLNNNTHLHSISFNLDTSQSFLLKSEAYLAYFGDFLKRYSKYNPFSNERKEAIKEFKKRRNILINLIALRIVKVFIKYGKLKKISQSATFIKGPDNTPIGMSSSIYRILFKIMKGLGLKLLDRGGYEIGLEDSVEFFRKRISYVKDTDDFGYDDIKSFPRSQ